MTQGLILSVNTPLLPLRSGPGGLLAGGPSWRTLSSQAAGRRMGTTAVLAVQQDNLVYVAGLGDSRAYLVRNHRVDQLTMDHTVADALERNGALTPEQAATSPWKHVLYKFLGCVEMNE